MWQTSGIIIFIIYVDCSRKNGIESPGWWNVDLQVGGMRILWVFECYTENFSRKVCFFNSNILKNFLLGIGGAQKCPLRPISDQKKPWLFQNWGFSFHNPEDLEAPPPHWWIGGRRNWKNCALDHFYPAYEAIFVFPSFPQQSTDWKYFTKRLKHVLLIFMW